MRLNQKVAPNQKLPKHNFLTLNAENCERLRGKSSYVVVSIDPAPDTFAFRIERREVSKKDPKKCSFVTTIELERIDFYDEKAHNRASMKADVGTKFELFSKITAYLDKYTEIYKITDLVLVESQMSYMNVRIAQHVETYFCLLEGNHLVVEISSKLKTKMLGCPTGFNRDATKRWTANKVKEILENRGDKIGLNVINYYHPDNFDVADTVAQAEAFFVHYKLPTSS